MITLQEIQLNIAYIIVNKLSCIKREDFRDKSIEETLKPPFLEVIQKEVNNLSNEDKEELVEQIRKEESSEENLETYFFKKLYTMIPEILQIDNTSDPMSTFYLEQTIRVLANEEFIDYVYQHE